MSAPPIDGMWVIDSSNELTPELVELARGTLESAATDGKQVVVVQGIEFRWRPTRIELPVIDVERLARAIRNVAGEEGYNIEYSAECRRLGVDAAAEYARLQNPEPAR